MKGLRLLKTFFYVKLYNCYKQTDLMKGLRLNMSVTSAVLNPLQTNRPDEGIETIFYHFIF